MPPYDGDLEEGLIYKTEEIIYLVPISSIFEIMSSMGEDFERDEDMNDDVREEDFSDEE